MIFNDYNDRLDRLYIGTIEAILPPDISNNSSQGYQYQYRVLLSIDGMAQTRAICVRRDTFGGVDDYEDLILEVGVRVYVLFPSLTRSVGIIVGHPRGYAKSQRTGERYYERRFGLITETITKTNGMSIVHDSGNLIKITPTQIIIDDGKTENITIDMDKNEISINTSAFNITVLKDATINVTGDTSLKTKGLDVVCQEAHIKAEKLDAFVVKEANVTAAGPMNIVGQTINLNGGGGEVITTLSQPVCYVTGIPFMGSKTVKAGA